MPWSAWQAGPTAIVSFQKYTYADLTFGGSLLPGWQTVDLGIAPLHAEHLDIEDSAGDGHGYGGVETKSQGTYFVVGEGWKTDRDWFPVTLLGLEEGVDYGIRPDRTDMDDDAYVQYEFDGDNTVTEEFKPIVRFENGDVGGGLAGEVDGDGIWSMGVVSNPTLPEQVSAAREYTVETWPGLGTTFVTSGVVAPGTYFSALFPDVSHLDTLFVSVRMTGSPPIYGTAGNVDIALGAPSFRYQMPRWRYWIPTEPPLRQRRRDDGLGLAGVPSARRGPSSRQLSNRTGRGYY